MLSDCPALCTDSDNLLLFPAFYQQTYPYHLSGQRSRSNSVHNHLLGLRLSATEKPKKKCANFSIHCNKICAEAVIHFVYCVLLSHFAATGMVARPRVYPLQIQAALRSTRVTASGKFICGNFSPLSPDSERVSCQLLVANGLTELVNHLKET